MILPLLALTLSHADPAAGPPKATLQFAQGDHLSGHPQSISGEEFLQWQSKLLENPSARFDIKTVESIRFGSGSRPRQTGAIAKVRFHNHVDGNSDLLQGELLSFDDETVRLKTWYAGELSLKRTMIDQVTVDSREPAFFVGPGKLEDWTIEHNEDYWRIEDQKLICEGNSAIAREFPGVPDRIKLSFKLEAPERPYIQVHAFASEFLGRNPQNTYNFSIQRGFVQLRKKSEGRLSILPERILIDTPDLDDLDDTSYNIELFLDRKDGEFAYYLNGSLIATWKDGAPNRGGDWFQFSLSQNQTFSLSNILIEEWKGELPAEALVEEVGPEPEMTGEDILLRNGDTVTGTIETVQNRKLLVNTDYAPIQIPLDRLKSFQLTNAETREEPRMWKGDVRAYFVDGGHVTIRVSSITPSTITGYSQIYGEATFDCRAFSRIEFNPYDLEFRKRRGQPF